MFDWKAVMKDGDEWSFEEVRARARGLYHKEWKDVKDWELNWHYPGCEWLAFGDYGGYGRAGMGWLMV
jgi:hypothetical protein